MTLWAFLTRLLRGAFRPSASLAFTRESSSSTAVAFAQALHESADRGKLILTEKPNGGDHDRG